MRGCPFLRDTPDDPASELSDATEICLHVLTNFYRAVDAGDSSLAMTALDDHVHFADESGEWLGRRAVESRLRATARGLTEIAVLSVSHTGRLMTLVAEVKRRPETGRTYAATRERVRHGFRLSQAGWRLVSRVQETDVSVGC